jgi:peptidoglycan/xylan/chitin deacetylase (PgdA/CDA1 family)
MIAAPPVNPVRAPLVVATTLAGPAAVHLEVRRGTEVVAVTPPVIGGPGPFGLPWSGGRGPTATGAPLPDGDYSLQLVDQAAQPLATTPAVIHIDRHPPRLSVRAPRIAIPEPTPVFGVRASDADGPVRMRIRVLDRTGAVLASGPWTPVAASAALPAALGRRGVVGPVVARVEVRDRAGNVTESRRILVSVPAPPGPPRIVFRVRTARPEVALVFDDGFDGPAIASILATLAARHAAATFCFNGVNRADWSARVRSAIRAAVARGRLDVCSHGYSHATGAGTGEAGGEADLRANVVFDRVAGVSTAPFYRPPYGAYGPGLVAAASALGYRDILLWNVDPSDYLRPGASAIAERVLAGLRPGGITVMHPLPETAQALPLILDGLAARRLRPVGISKLLRDGVPAG